MLLLDSLLLVLLVSDVKYSIMFLFGEMNLQICKVADRLFELSMIDWGGWGRRVYIVLYIRVLGGLTRSAAPKGFFFIRGADCDVLNCSPMLVWHYFGGWMVSR